MTELMEMLELCDECQACLDVCPTYKVTQDDEFSPIGRIKAARKIFQGEEVTPQMIESIYNCPDCYLCTSVCPYEIDIPEIVHQSRVELVKRGLGPPERHRMVIEIMQRVSNPVDGDPARRLDWLPEPFPTHESSTLLYAGCLPSYWVKDAATSSYLLLKKLGVDFMILPDEGCCWFYAYNAGMIDLAQEKFEENVDRFKKLGIKKIITLCPGCCHCFEQSYPMLLGNIDFEAVHIIQLLPSLLKEKEIKIGDQLTEVTYHDSCGLGRLMGIYDEPREALRLSGVKVNELPENRENSSCCGGMMWAAYRGLALELASTVLKEAPVDPIVNSCPFCDFCLSWASRKTGKEREIVYITNAILKALP